jgi:Ulp1 family protease
MKFVPLKNHIWNKKLLFIPVHLNKNHWMVVAVDLRDAKMYSLDSNATKPSVASLEVSNNIRKWLSKHHVIHIKDIFFSPPQQKNDNDCGVYALRFIRRGMADGVTGLKKLETENWTEKTMAIWRKKIWHELKRGKLDADEKVVKLK